MDNKTKSNLNMYIVFTLIFMFLIFFGLLELKQDIRDIKSIISEPLPATNDLYGYKLECMVAFLDEFNFTQYYNSKECYILK